jgi:antitoxin PrlF
MSLQGTRLDVVFDRLTLCPALTQRRLLWYYIIDNVMETDVESAITTKGQATIPKVIREHLGLKPGDRVKFFVHPDGSVVLLPKLPASVLRGMVKSRRRRPVTVEEMSESAAQGAAGGKPRAKRR